MKIYVCSPYSGDESEIIENIQFVKKKCKELTIQNYRPVAPHLYYTQFLDDSLESERMIGIKAALLDLRECDKMIVYKTFKNKISEGMKMEIEFAEKLGIPIEYL